MPASAAVSLQGLTMSRADAATLTLVREPLPAADAAQQLCPGLCSEELPCDVPHQALGCSVKPAPLPLS